MFAELIFSSPFKKCVFSPARRRASLVILLSSILRIREPVAHMAASKGTGITSIGGIMLDPVLVEVDHGSAEGVRIFGKDSDKLFTVTFKLRKRHPAEHSF